MENNKIVKDIKTSAKFVRIARTMLRNCALSINDSNSESQSAIIINEIANSLDKLDKEFDNTINSYNQEIMAPGVQLSLF